MAKLESLDDPFVDELRDLYNAESQLVKALPKMAEAARGDGLALVTHAAVEAGARSDASIIP